MWKEIYSRENKLSTIKDYSWPKLFLTLVIVLLLCFTTNNADCTRVACIDKSTKKQSNKHPQLNDQNAKCEPRLNKHSYCKMAAIHFANMITKYCNVIYWYCLIRFHCVWLYDSQPLPRSLEIPSAANAFHSNKFPPSPGVCLFFKKSTNNFSFLPLVKTNELQTTYTNRRGVSAKENASPPPPLMHTCIKSIP